MTGAPLEAELLARLDAERRAMAAELAELVDHESPSADPDLLRRCAAALAGMGAEVLGSAPDRVEVEDKVHLRWDFGRSDGKPGVFLVGHYDTVWPAGTIERWPFTIDDAGRASGPGAFDMKAGIVQMLHAVAASRTAIADLPVTVLITADEEIGSPSSRRLIEAAASGADAALVLEPSSAGALKISRKGTSMYEVVVTGRSAHAGLEPEKGVNATVELAHHILAMTEVGDPDNGTTVTPTVISGGTTTNTVPAAAVLHVDARALSVAEQERVDRSVRALRPVLPGAALEIRGGINRPPLDPEASAQLMERARAVAARLGMPEPAAVGVGGGSDGNFTAGIGIPTLDGLGANGDGAHAEGEYVVLADMPERAALVAGLLVDLATSR